MCVLIAQTLHPALGARRDLSLRRGVLKLWVCGIFIEFFFATTDSCGDPATSLSKRPLRDQNKNSFIEDCEDT